MLLPHDVLHLCPGAHLSFQFIKGFIERDAEPVFHWLPGLSKSSLMVPSISPSPRAWYFLWAGCVLLETHGQHRMLWSAFLVRLKRFSCPSPGKPHLKCIFKFHLNWLKLNICLENALLTCFWDLALIENFRLQVWLKSSARVSQS